ncbi:lysophospholipid acyltransferase family protein [Nitrospirillum iridis]|uniref:1-acyl-sn-glycerol-3-phosphate acyltransferase n=1 Tax=Nitrospirillum iridis TaxID=765888 RepID=A0A7X0B5A4_9PROT|nr:lysophospholipid acyltransferase family protein [Nitrospirillum iridis]MBB6254905.1 1-acyl-sn-glycerol-3-phosphate acyltransferase [Nitrospirillum iridis]
MAIGSPRAGSLRLALYLAWTFLCIPVQAALVSLNLPGQARFPRFYHRVCCRLMLALDVDVVGERSVGRPTLFVSNHSSYLDIPVLGSVLDCSFVAKSEVGMWPLFGLLAKLQRTVFVNRANRREAGKQRDDMAGRLVAGDSLVLFPEGTSSDGNRVLPFKTALFAVANTQVNGHPVAVQPVSVVCTHLDGLPLGHELRPLYAWYGDMELPPHLWQMIGAGRLRIRVEFHPVVSLEDFSSRKALADHCFQVVAAGVDRAVSGRWSRPLRPARPVGGPAVGVLPGATAGTA